MLIVGTLDGTLLVGAGFHQVDVKDKGTRSSVDGSGADRQALHGTERSQFPIILISVALIPAALINSDSSFPSVLIMEWKRL